MHKILTLIAAMILLPFTSSAQDGRATLERAAAALGGATLTSIEYTATGNMFDVGQSAVPGQRGPQFILKNYVRSINYETGSLRTDLERTSRAALGDRVVFTGWVHDLPRLYAALDVVALTSRNEGTPVALIEAAAAGRPVVATRVGGVADVVRDGVTGALVDAGDAAGIARELLKVLADAGLARARGDAARAHVRDRFSAERLEDDIVALYEELLGPR